MHKNRRHAMHTDSARPPLTYRGEGQRSLQAKGPCAAACVSAEQSAAGSIKVGMRSWCLWSRVRWQKMICSVSVIE